MSKEDIIKYVMHTPHNTNPNVLKTILNSDNNFKIVDIQIHNQRSEYVRFYAPVISEEDNIAIGMGFVGPNSRRLIQVILYNNEALLSFYSPKITGDNVLLEGDITFDTNTYCFNIYGNGLIDISKDTGKDTGQIK